MAWNSKFGPFLIATGALLLTALTTNAQQPEGVYRIGFLTLVKLEVDAIIAVATPAARAGLLDRTRNFGNAD